MVQIGHDWGFYALVTDLPKYMNDVLLLPVKENGLYSALPYLVMWIVSVTMGFLSDWLIVRDYLSITNARKLFTATGKQACDKISFDSDHNPYGKFGKCCSRIKVVKVPSYEFRHGHNFSI